MYPNTSLIKGISKKWCVITLFKQFSWDLAFTLKKKKKKSNNQFPSQVQDHLLFAPGRRLCMILQHNQPIYKWAHF